MVSFLHLVGLLVAFCCYPIFTFYLHFFIRVVFFHHDVEGTFYLNHPVHITDGGYFMTSAS